MPQIVHTLRDTPWVVSIEEYSKQRQLQPWRQKAHIIGVCILRVAIKVEEMATTDARAPKKVYVSCYVFQITF